MVDGKMWVFGGRVKSGMKLLLLPLPLPPSLSLSLSLSPLFLSFFLYYLSENIKNKMLLIILGPNRFFGSNANVQYQNDLYAYDIGITKFYTFIIIYFAQGFFRFLFLYF